MAKVATCKDAGLNCDFIIRGETEDELLENAREHASDAHPTQWEQSSLNTMGAEFVAHSGGGSVITPSNNSLEEYLLTIVGSIEDE